MLSSSVTQHLSGGAGNDTFILNPSLSGLDIVTDFSHKKISGRAEKLAALADAAEIRWGLGSYFSQISSTNDNTKQETLIYDTRGTAS